MKKDGRDPQDALSLGAFAYTSLCCFDETLSLA